MIPASKRPMRVAIMLAAVVAAVVVVLAVTGGSDDASAPKPIPLAIHAEDFRRSTVYASPQEPGYTAWSGAWLMPDGSTMAALIQATGPVDPARRDLAPPRVVRAFGRSSWEPARDFWGLELRLRYLRSSDGGRMWRTVRSEPFRALIPHGYIPQATIALKDGTLLRRVNGDDLRQDPDLPHTAFLQRLAPRAGRWSEPQVLLDPKRFTYQISRLRRLRDGRIVATGNVWRVPASTPPPKRRDVPSSFLLMVSSDEGRTWSDGLTIPASTGYLPGDEWDTAELASGDLLAVMRTRTAPGDDTPVRKQAILRRDGAGWVLTRLRESPLTPSGHPELLATREGPILHLATEGAHYTTNGITWTPLEFRPRLEYRSRYYPRAVQRPDGTVQVFGHVGGDDEYGEQDQSVTVDSFRIVPDAVAP